MNYGRDSGLERVILCPPISTMLLPVENRSSLVHKQNGPANTHWRGRFFCGPAGPRGALKLKSEVIGEQVGSAIVN